MILGFETLDETLCPFSTAVHGLKLLRGCLLQEAEETGPSKTKTYLAQCPSKGYRENYERCPDYRRAKEKNLDPMELKQQPSPK